MTTLQSYIFSIRNSMILLLTITYFTCAAANAGPTQPQLRNDTVSLAKASNDYGNIVHDFPSGVLNPSSNKDIINLIKWANKRRPGPITVAARGHGHSVRGQAMALGGVVVDMSTLSGGADRIKISGNEKSGFYADVGGEQLWSDVLRAALQEGLAPLCMTNYIYLTVGGTLSNAGISGQASKHGPQISNVLELDVITGKGEFITCSKKKNPELFFGVLGGLGQFGIITRARIVLEKAATRVKWVRLLYSNFTTFSRDQEHLISSNSPNHVEGILVTNGSVTNQWRATFSTPSNQSDIVSLLNKQGILYAIELLKYYDNQTAQTIDQEFQALLDELSYIPGLIFNTDVTLNTFLTRVPNQDSVDNPTGARSASQPWLVLFIPKSRVHDFNAGVLATMIPNLNQTSGTFTFSPFNRTKWDDRMSAVTPAEEIFYGMLLLISSRPDEYQVYDEFNSQILEFCETNGIVVKQYLANIQTQQEWIKHYGPKWATIQRRKALFDPKMILSPGQKIFNFSDGTYSI